MSRKRRKIHDFRSVRTPPGTSGEILIADPEAAPPSIRVLSYRPDSFQEITIRELDRLEEILKPLLAEWPVNWVDVAGLRDVAVIKKLGEIFDFHPLALEDIVHVHQRPKVENFGDHLFIFTRMFNLHQFDDTEQFSCALGANFVVSFQEEIGDCLDPIRHRIRQRGGRLRESGPDFLVYALLDALIDGYFPGVEELSERLETLETELLENPHTNNLTEIHKVKRGLLLLRRALWPLREALVSLHRDAHRLFKDETRVYLLDCHDHVVQLIDLIETYREISSDLVDMYLSNVNTRMNEVMKVLTIISTIFMPLSFIAGVYGMNFNPQSSRWNMPELNWVFGYPFALLLMAVVAIALIYFFFRKGWLSSFSASQRRSR